MPETLTKPSAEPRPAWLRARLPSGENYEKTRQILDGLRLVTVCREALCPNVSECWGHGTATIMVLGDTCTRGCRFCAVNTGNPGGKVDPTEPERVAAGVSAMGMKYIVLTSVDRDDLPDGGAAHFAACVRAIKQRAPQVKVETLIPDFRGDRRALTTLCDSEPDVVAQNIETVERLTHYARDKRAGYQQTLNVLEYVKKIRPAHFTKTGLMLGLGETDGEIEHTMKDLRSVDVDILTLGQYLQPTRKHLAVSRYVTPEEFLAYGQMARAAGFRAVASAPFVRSSYRADALI